MTKAKYQILVVEDETDISMFFEDALKFEGYSVCGIASTGEDALALCRQEQPNLVLMDIGLAGRMDGLEAAKTISAEQDISIIFLTGYSDRETREAASAISRSAYLVKPVALQDLLAAIESMRAGH